MTDRTAGVHVERRGEVAVLVVDNPPVNGLNAALRQGLADGLAAALASDEVAALVIRGAGRMFSAGADIREFNTAPAQAEPKLPALCDLVEGAAKPVVAALHGTAMGGGLELALACHYRIAAPATSLGLPEVTLGLVPGAGGTQRLPRLVGVEAALEMIVSGQPVTAERGLELGLVDRLAECGADDFTDYAAAFARAMVWSGPRPTRARDELVVAARGRPEIFADHAKRIANRARGVEAPFACIACVQAAVERPYGEGAAFERATFRRCVESAQSKALRHAFFAERAAGKVAGLPADARPRQTAQAAVVGCGTMGAGIAMCFANAGIPVRVVEADGAALARGLATVKATYAASASRGRLSPAEAERRRALIAGATELREIGDADVIIEAVFEDMALKQEVFRALDRVAGPDAILATNTSSLNVDEIAAVTGRPERVIGTHFFSPAHVMRLMENVRGARTDAETIATVMALAKRLGKTGVLVGVCDGFVGNRMLDPYQRQANQLLLEGALPHQVDEAMRAFGFAMGPFAVSDLAGIDVGWRVRQERLKRDPGRAQAAPIADRLYEMGRLGQKCGAGWYRYAEGSRAPERDPAVERLVEEVSTELGIARRPIGDDEIFERCLYPMVNEAARILEEGIVQRASDIDVVWLHGYGFPRHRGGPLHHADSVGLDRVYDAVRRLHERLGPAYAPAPLLVRLAESGGRFADLPDPYPALAARDGAGGETRQE